jgi:hypothetical protein
LPLALASGWNREANPALAEHINLAKASAKFLTYYPLAEASGNFIKEKCLSRQI